MYVLRKTDAGCVRAEVTDWDLMELSCPKSRVLWLTLTLHSPWVGKEPHCLSKAKSPASASPA